MSGCPNCGAPALSRKRIGGANSTGGTTETSYQCGSVNHSDGFDKGFACIKPSDVPEEPAIQSPGLLGDMTALALSAGIRGMTVEDVHQRVTRICGRHGLKPFDPMRDRVKIADFAHRIGLAVSATGRPEIADEALDATLDTLLEDIRSRLNLITIEMRENA